MQNILKSSISIEELKDIICYIGNFSQDNLINAITGKGYTKEKVFDLTAKVSLCHSQLTNQMSHFFAFSTDYNSKFATNNNKCFDTAQLVLKKAHKSMSEA